MSVQTMLKEMGLRTFDSSYDNYLKADYDKWAKDAYQEEEREYAIATVELAKILDTQKAEKLETMEKNYQANREYAARYGFKAGLFSGFGQYFGDLNVSEEGFESTLMKNLLEMPGMARHIEFYNRNEEILALGKELDENLDDEAQEHLVSIGCTWGQRIHSAACHSFYCGYRAAIALIDAVSPMEGYRMIANTLLLEYKLGYTRSYEEVERMAEKQTA